MTNPPKRPNSGTKRQYGQYTPEQSMDDYSPRGTTTRQSGLSRQTTYGSERGPNTVIAGVPLTEDPDEVDFDAESSRSSASTQARELPPQASPPPPSSSAAPSNLASLHELFTGNPHLASAFAQFLQQHSAQQATPEPETATPPPTSPPNAAQAPPAQAQASSATNGHFYGGVTVRGNKAKVSMGNVGDTGTRPELVKNHYYVGATIEEQAAQANVHMGDMGVAAFQSFLNSGYAPAE